MNHLQKRKKKAEKIAKLRRSCDSFCVHNLQSKTFVCPIVIDSPLELECSIITKFSFCLHECNGNLSSRYNNWKLLFTTFLFSFVISTFLCITSIDIMYILTSQKGVISNGEKKDWYLSHKLALIWLSITE